jgi:hypothetical protein
MAAAAKGVQPADIAWQFWASWAMALVLLAIGLVVAFTSGHPKATFTPTGDFDRFAAFYVVAQAIERFVAVFSPVIPPFGDDAASKNDRAIIVTAGTFLIGVLIARLSGLLFLTAIGWTTPSGGIDVLVTGLVLSGGTKALHDLISRVQKPGTTSPPPAGS